MIRLKDVWRPTCVTLKWDDGEPLAIQRLLEIEGTNHPGDYLRLDIRTADIDAADACSVGRRCQVEIEFEEVATGKTKVVDQIPPLRVVAALPKAKLKEIMPTVTIHLASEFLRLSPDDIPTRPA